MPFVWHCKISIDLQIIIYITLAFFHSLGRTPVLRDNDDDDDDDELFFWLTAEKHLALFPAETIFRDPHHRESPTCHITNLSAGLAE